MNIVEEKAFDFAVRIVKLSQQLTDNQKEFVLSKQILKSGTSIGANIAEAQEAQTKKDFVAKLSIAHKETAETKYWLRLLNATDYVDEKLYRSLLNDCCELDRIISSIILTSKNERNKH